MKQLFKNQFFLAGLGIFIGMVILAINVFLIHLSGEVYVLVISVFCCILGITLLIIYLVNFNIYFRNPKSGDTQGIASKDKRNIIAGNKEGLKTIYYTLKWFINNKLLVGMTAFGVALLTISLVLTYGFHNAELETLYSICGGIGAALIGYVLLFMLISWYGGYQSIKEPKAYHKSVVEARDERNVILWEKSVAHGTYIMAPIFVAVSFLFYLLGAEWYVIATPLGLCVLNFIIALVYKNYYKKRM